MSVERENNWGRAEGKGEEIATFPSGQRNSRSRGSPIYWSEGYLEIANKDMRRRHLGRGENAPALEDPAESNVFSS